MAFSATTSTALRYWNMARQRYCRRLAQNPYTLRVSADPLVAAGRAHPRGRPGFSTYGSELRARDGLSAGGKPDSNSRSLPATSAVAVTDPRRPMSPVGAPHFAGGTDNSNPVASSSKSCANRTSSSGRDSHRCNTTRRPVPSEPPELGAELSAPFPHSDCREYLVNGSVGNRIRSLREGVADLKSSRKASPFSGGTSGSNPIRSSGEMVWGRRRGNGTIVAVAN